MSLRCCSLTLPCLALPFLREEEALHVASHSNASRQRKEKSRNVGYTHSGGSCFSVASDIYGPT